MYSFAEVPDIAFYFRVPPDVAMDRILEGRPKLKYYEAGMDLDLSNDEYDSYRIFQSRIVDQYEAMVKKDNFAVIDGTLDIEEQQNLMRSHVSRLLPRLRPAAQAGSARNQEAEAT